MTQPEAEPPDQWEVSAMLVLAIIRRQPMGPRDLKALLRESPARLDRSKVVNALCWLSLRDLAFYDRADKVWRPAVVG